MLGAQLSQRLRKMVFPYIMYLSSARSPTLEHCHPRAMQEVLRTRKALVPPSQAVTCFGIKYESPGIFYLAFILGACPLHPPPVPPALQVFDCCMS